MRITAAVATERRKPFTLMAADLPAPGPGQLLVTIHAAGICHTDLGFRDLDMPNAMPIVLGHEGAGTVAALGPGVTGFAVGDRVCLSYDSCGHCGACTGHAPQYCDELGLRNFAGVTPAMAPPMAFPDGTPLFGNFFGQSSFATHALSTVRNTVKIPDALPFHLAAPLGCGMQTGAGTVVNSLAGAPGKSLVVFGTGSVGLAAIMAAAALGMAPIVAVDRVQSRLALARALGATHGLTADEASLVSLAAISPGFDGSFDTTGVPGVIQLAIDCLGTRGTCALVGITPPGTLASFSPAGFLMGKKIIGVIEGDADPQIFVPWLAKQHLAGRFPHDRLVTTFPFDRINDAVDAMHQGEVVKPVLLMP